EPDIEAALRVAACCNDAVLQTGKGASHRLKSTSNWKILGDPTEGALLVLAKKGGIDPDKARRRHPRVAEIPFDSDRKRMSVVVREGNELVAYVKGAPDVILPRCRWVVRQGALQELTAADRRRFAARAEAMASSALRVLALAYRKVDPALLSQSGGPPSRKIEAELVFAGLAAMIDPPRSEAMFAIAKARRAGVETLMVTADHPKTAAAIAARLGLGSGPVVTGEQSAAMDEEALFETVRHARIFARVSP